MRNKIEHFYLSKEEPNKSCLLALQQIILGVSDHFSEGWKYGMPVFLYRNKILCYLWIDRKSNNPYILFANGMSLNHPRLERGNRSRMKILRVDPKHDLPNKVIIEILQSAIAVNN